MRDYFIKHPEAVGRILAELIKHRSSAPTSAGAAAKPGPDRAAIRGNAAELFASPHQVTLGDPQGDVTLVEFFDYNCGFCKRALADTLALLRDETRLKVVLKEFPILGPGSTEAARVAIAARMQDPAKYLAFHQELLGAPGPATEQKALDAAKDQGFDMARLEKDMTSDEVAATIAENMKLASRPGLLRHAKLCDRQGRHPRRRRRRGAEGAYQTRAGADSGLGAVIVNEARGFG